MDRNTLLLCIYFKLIGYWLTIERVVHKIMPRIYIVKNSKTMTDCTLAYYVGYNKYGSYVVTIITEAKTYRMLHKGFLQDIPSLQPKTVSVKRKNVLLYNGDEVINADLNMLDDFYSYDIRLDKACKYVGITCTKAKIISKTFDFKEYDAKDLSLLDIYC